MPLTASPTRALPSGLAMDFLAANLLMRGELPAQSEPSRRHEGRINMDNQRRALIALAILFSGFLLVPFFTLPAEAVEWQRYSGGYETPTVTPPVTSIEQNPVEIASDTGGTPWLIPSLILMAGIVGLGWWALHRRQQRE
jgi:hypothetical protein